MVVEGAVGQLRGGTEIALLEPYRRVPGKRYGPVAPLIFDYDLDVKSRHILATCHTPGIAVLPIDNIAGNDDDHSMGYPGGKGKCYQHIINILPPHRTYIETHLGGGSVLRQKKPAALSIGVDRDPVVVRRWRTLFPTLARYVEADAVAFLTSHQFFGDEVVYCDPPYLPSTRRHNPVYRYDYREADHTRLLDTLQNVPCPVVISGYPSQLYDDYLREWSTRTFTARTRQGVREEKLWFNFEAPDCVHDTRYLGRNFRERQTIKRRLERLQKRIRGLSPQEQSALFNALDDSRLTSTQCTGNAENATKCLGMLHGHESVQLSLFMPFALEPVSETSTEPIEKKAFQRAELGFDLGSCREAS